MTLLLIFLFGTVGLGLLMDRFDRSTYRLLIVTCVLVIALYYFTNRFMT